MRVAAGVRCSRSCVRNAPIRDISLGFHFAAERTLAIGSAIRPDRAQFRSSVVLALHDPFAPDDREIGHSGKIVRIQDHRRGGQFDAARPCI